MRWLTIPLEHDEVVESSTPQPQEHADVIEIYYSSKGFLCRCD